MAYFRRCVSLCLEFWPTLMMALSWMTSLMTALMTTSAKIFSGVGTSNTTIMIVLMRSSWVKTLVTTLMMFLLSLRASE